ncbi:hypothetical protein [Paraflavitalea speifideaquila]|uniref:hypothetical protein n=1 Tax=Paraflavitalea speifideaquila TaxID=3076558 RepID=UPI0028E428D5|nr:hypothetical protein [Paraflavitalea speifideiaquila]
MRVTEQQGPLVGIEANWQPPLQLSMQLHASSHQLCIVALGIYWYHEVKKARGVKLYRKPGSLAILKAWPTDGDGKHIY